MTMDPKKDNALNDLLQAASHEVLTKLIVKLAREFPDVRRECFDFLKSSIVTRKAQRTEYARKAKVMAKIRRVLVEVLGDEPRWKNLHAKSNRTISGGLRFKRNLLVSCRTGRN